jgi:hypothetical protein
MGTVDRIQRSTNVAAARVYRRDARAGIEFDDHVGGYRAAVSNDVVGDIRLTSARVRSRPRSRSA